MKFSSVQEDKKPINIQILNTSESRSPCCDNLKDFYPNRNWMFFIIDLFCVSKGYLLRRRHSFIQSTKYQRLIKLDKAKTDSWQMSL